MQENIKNCKTLCELFSSWNDSTHEIFCEDGFIDKDIFNKQGNRKLLFIAKESNTVKEEKESSFWLKKVAFGEESHTILSRRISMMANAYFSNNFKDKNIDRNILKNITYMNINKRGGSNRTKSNELKKYACDYREYIIKEIEIIKPNLIVCCSNLVYGIIDEIKLDIDISCEIVQIYHPSYFKISDQEYLNKFYDALK